MKYTLEICEPVGQTVRLHHSQVFDFDDEHQAAMVKGVPMTECDEVADNMALQLARRDLPQTMDEARAIVREQMPEETMTVIDNVAEALLARARFK